MHTDRCGNTSGHECQQKEAEEKLKYIKYIKIQEFKYRYTTNVEHEMYDYTGNNWSHRNSNKRYEDKFVSHTSQTFSRFTKTDSCTCNIKHNTESTAV
jgi:hypothetical protein